jgi:LysR family transcriptional regulator, transcriptional activator for dmlA
MQKKSSRSSEECNNNWNSCEKTKVDKKSSAANRPAFQRSSFGRSANQRPVHLAPLDPTWALYFSAVAEHASISRAAELMSVSPSTVSRKLDELETSVGVRLFDRDTRNLRLTEAGDTYLHYVRHALHMLDEGRQVMDSYSSEVRGQLRVWCPPALARRFVADIVMSFASQYPRLDIILKLEPRPYSLSHSDFDVGICIGMPPEDRAVISKLCSYRRGYVATPAFLRSFGEPRTIDDLVQLPIVKIAHEEQLSSEVHWSNPNGETVNAISKLVVNDSEIGLRAIMSGQYIGKTTYWHCLQHLLDGNLQRVLPELSDEKTLYSLVPARKGNPMKVQLFVDFLKMHLAPQLLASEQQIDTMTLNSA